MITTHLIFQSPTGITTRAVAGLVAALEAELPGVWNEAHTNPMPGAGDPLNDLGGWAAAREGLEYLGPETGRYVARWASWTDEREHIQRTSPDEFARLENVEQAPVVRKGKSHKEFMEESYAAEVEDRWQRRQAASNARAAVEQREAEMPDWLRRFLKRNA